MTELSIYNNSLHTSLDKAIQHEQCSAFIATMKTHDHIFNYPNIIYEKLISSDIINNGVFCIAFKDHNIICNNIFKIYIISKISLKDTIAMCPSVFEHFNIENKINFNENIDTHLFPSKNVIEFATDFNLKIHDKYNIRI